MNTLRASLTYADLAALHGGMTNAAVTYIPISKWVHRDDRGGCDCNKCFAVWRAGRQRGTDGDKRKRGRSRV